MTLWVKVCGITQVKNAVTCVEAGADAIGLVFADSPRRVDIETAVEIADEVRASVAVVAVFRKPTPGQVATVHDSLGPDLVQGDQAYLPDVDGVSYLPVVRQGADQPIPNTRFLYEGEESGTGETVDWSVAADLARMGEMVLAGGLSASNVVEAVESVRPAGVDVSSGVEIAPGVKDDEMIRQFLRAARSATTVTP